MLELSTGKAVWASRLSGSHTRPAFSSDGKKIIYSGSATAIIVSDLNSNKQVIGCGSPVLWDLAISRGDRFLAAAGSMSREVLLWDLKRLVKPVRVWANLTPNAVTRVAFTPDGRRLLSAHGDGSICVFKVPDDLPVWRGFPPLDRAWLARTTQLPADEQVKEVAAELARRNPGFNDSLQILKDGEGRVWSVSVQTTQLEDLSPFRGFPALREIKVEAHEASMGKMWDLSCLQGIRLTTLFLRGNRICDISPLRDMPLTFLVLNGNPLFDLSPLRKMRLWNIALCGTNVHDISPLKGMPLEAADLHYTPIKDLSPLSKSPVKYIGVSAPDLEPLRELPLEAVALHGDYKLEQIKMILGIPTLKKLTLADVKYGPEQLKEFRGNPILKTINGKPAAEFWKSAEKK